MKRADVLVVGAGPAGMAAAAVAAESGCRVVLVDDNAAPGGQIWRGYAAAGDTDSAQPGAHLRWARRLRSANVEVLAGARVIGSPAAGVLRMETEDAGSDLAWDRLILATGARERFLPFPGWTLPGVMGAGGVQAMVKSGLPIAGKRVVLSGSGPLLLAVAANLARHGAQVEGIFEQAPFARVLRFGAGLIAHPSKLVEGARCRIQTFSAPYRTTSWVVRAKGEGRLQSVAVQSRGATREIACDFLGCGFHLVANLELPHLLGCAVQSGAVRVDASQQSSVAGIFCAGELTGIGGLDKALIEGEIAGLAAAGRSASPSLLRRRNAALVFARRLEAAFSPRDELRQLADAETIVCRCEDVRHVALAGLRNGREARLHTRCGMGPCQGRMCGPAASLLFGWEIGGVRPPIQPALLSTLAAPCDPAPSGD